MDNFKAIFDHIFSSLVAGALAQGIYELVQRGFFAKIFGRNQHLQLPTSRNPLSIAQILFFIIPKRNREHIFGDMEEEYRTTSKRFPRLWYWGQVFTLVASYWWASLRRRLGFDAVLKMIRK